MSDLWGCVYREFKLLTGDRTNLLLSGSSILVYVLLFGTSMTRFISTVEYSGRTIRYSDFALPALLVFAMVASATTVATSLFQEKLARMDIELWSYPLRKPMYVGGKIAVSVAMVLLQTGLALALALGVFRLSWPVANVPFILLGVVVAAGSLIGLFMLLATVISEFQRFIVLVNVLGPVMLFSSASFYPLESMPTPIRWASLINPMTYAIRAVRDSAIFGSSRVLVLDIVLALVAMSSWILVGRGLVRRARTL